MARVKKQTELAGMEKPTNPELDKLLERQAELSTALGETRQEFGEVNESILAKMAELNLSVYRHETAVPPILATVKHGTSRVKVKRVGPVEVDEVFADEADE